MSTIGISSSGNTLTVNGKTANAVNSVSGSVSGNNLNISVNGVAGQVAIPSSSEWEEIPLDDFPDDFTQNDRVLIYCNADLQSTNQPTAWTHQITQYTTLEVYSPSDKRPRLVIDGFTSGVSKLVVSFTAGTSYCSGIYAIINGYTNWNIGISGSNNNLFRLYGFMFNGSSSKNVTVNVTEQNLTKYVSKIYRHNR